MKPYQSALMASCYIAIITMFFAYVPRIIQSTEDGVDSPFAPMIMLSLLVLSVAVMGFLFFYEPMVLLMQGNTEKAVRTFLSTVGIFAVVTIFFIIGASFL